MAVLAGQTLTTLTAVFFGVLALAVARHGYAMRGPEVRVLSWLVVALAFVFGSLVSIVQDAWAILGFIAGPGSDEWDAYVRIAPAINHARGFIVLGGLILLLVAPIVRVRTFGTVIGQATAVLLAMAALGMYGGLMEGPLVGLRHNVLLAILGSFELLLLATVLLFQLVWNAADRLLWITLCIYGVHLAIGTAWATALAWRSVPGAWTPSLTLLTALDAATFLAMATMAMYALVLTRRGVYIPALLEDPQPLKTAALP